MSVDVVKKLIEKKISISFAESITGGLLSKLVTDVPGSSSILSESFVIYSNEAKVKNIGVDKNLIDKYGVVSSEVAKDMATKLKIKTNSDLCISTTGNAGPTICDDKPVGRVYVGILYIDNINVYELNLNGDRSDIRNKTCEFIFNKIDELIR